RVSEGTLFKRFRTKAELFRAVVGKLIEDDFWLEPLQESPRNERDLEARLVELTARGCARYRVLMPLVMTAWSSASEGFLPDEIFGEEPPQRAEIQAVAAFLDRAMRRGLLARRDAQAAARLLLGAMQHFAILALDPRKPADERDHARRTVAVLL